MELKDDADLEKFLADSDASVVGEFLVMGTFRVAHLLFRHRYSFLWLILHPDVTDLFFPGFFADDKSTAQAEFLKAASALRDNYRFAHSNSEDLLKSHDIEGE